MILKRSINCFINHKYLYIVLTRHNSSTMKGLVLGVYTKSSDNHNKVIGYTSSFKDFDKKCNGQLSEFLTKTGPFYKPAKQRLFWLSMLNTPVKVDIDCLSVVDLGVMNVKDNHLERLDQKAENVRCAIANGVKALRGCSNFEDIYLDACESPQSAAEAAYLVTHTYDELKQKSSNPKSNFHLYKYEDMPPNYATEFEKGVVFAKCQNFARVLTETPANRMTPTIFAETVAEKFSSNTEVKVIIREKDWIESMKMGSFLSVAQGSEQPPKFLEIHYNGLPNSEENVALVGKGVTFDSGGISIKPSANMDRMRGDMGGAACVVSTILAASLLKMKINIKGFIPLTENLPSGKATKPGDVVFAMNGKSIQVDNTDAEGRMVLADALCYSEKFNPMFILDVATLTGAITVALGSAAAGAFSNDDELWNLYEKAGYITGDRVWRMPLYKAYTKKATDARLADLNNIPSGREGGSCYGAAFLQEFLSSGTKWIHTDIAGVMEHKDDVPYLLPGMSGRPTRTMVQFLQYLADKN